MATRKTKKSKAASGPRTLSFDIGGTGLKAMILDAAGKPVTERQRIDTPRPATPEALVAALGELAKLCVGAHDRVSAGFPGVVVDGVVQTAPNLDGDWAGFDLAAALGKLTKKPVRVANDADVQGWGVIEGKGVELVLTLGTGIGSALFVDGNLVPNLELGHHPLNKKGTYEEYLDNATVEEIGRKKWSKRLREAIAVLEPIFNYRVLYLGGGNAKKIKGDLPKNVKLVDNAAGITGGVALWKH